MPLVLLLLPLLLLMPLLFSFCHCYCRPRDCLQLTPAYDLFHAGRQVIGTCDGFCMLEERRCRLVYPLRHRHKIGHDCCGLASRCVCPICCHFRRSVGAVPVACVWLARPRAHVGIFVRVARVRSVRLHAVHSSVGAAPTACAHASICCYWGVCPSVGVRSSVGAVPACVRLARPCIRVGIFVRVARVQSARLQAVRPSVGAAPGILVHVARAQSASPQVRAGAAARAVRLPLARIRCVIAL